MRSRITHFKHFILHKLRRKTENSLRFDICGIDVHRASIAKQLGSKKHLHKIRLTDVIVPDWLFQETNEKVHNIQRRIPNPKLLKQIAREKFKIDDKQLNKELAKK